MTELTSPRLRAVLALTVGLVGFFLFLPSVDHGPVLDDAALLADDGASALDRFGRGLFSGVRDYGGYYRPLTALSFHAEARLGFGLAARHGTNVLLHGLVSALAFLLLARLGDGRDLFVPFGAALLFAVHPVHVDAIDPITGRGDLLATAFLLLAWIAFDVGRERGAPAWPFLLALAAFAAGLLCKESAAVFPALALAGEWIRRRAAHRPSHWLALAGVLGAYLLLRTVILGGFMEAGLPDPLDNPLAGAGIAARLFGAPVAWLEMGRLLLWPWPMSPDYSGGALAISAGIDLRPLGGWVLALALLGGWLASARGRGPVFLGLTILLVGVLPGANLLFTAPVLVAGRLLYLPSLGVTLLLAGLLGILGRRRGLLLGAAVAAGWIGMTLALHPIYFDDLAVWSQATRVVPENGKAWYNLGNARMRRGLTEEAAAAYARAAEEEPGLAIAWSNLGIARARTGQEEEGIRALRRAVALDPSLAQAHAALGSLALRRGELGEAVRHLETALALDPAGPDAEAIRGRLRDLPRAPSRRGSDDPD